MNSVSRNSSSRWSLVVFVAILLLAVVLRIVAADLRPFHSDEGVNFHFIQELFKKGYYPYSHQNYHGPLYFYLTGGLVYLFGFNEWAFRLCPLICSVAMPLLLLLLWKQVHQSILLIGALALASSASLVFFGRYAIHESLFGLASLWFAISVFQWLLSRHRVWFFHAGVSLAFLITTKETFVISIFCIFWAFVCTAIIQSMRDGWKYSRISASNSTLVNVLHRLHLEAFWSLFSQRHVIALGFFLCVLLVCFCFSGGFQWSGGLREMFLAVPQWVGRNESDSGHFKPILYYAQMLIGTPSESFLNKLVSRHAAGGAELHLGISLLVSFPILLRECLGKESLFQRSTDAYFFIFVSVWALLSFCVYSLLNYKTPWLIINISMPLCLVFGSLLFLLIERYKVEGYAIACVFFVSMVSQMAYYNYLRPYGNVREKTLWRLFTFNDEQKALSVHPYSYVHTAPGFLSLLEDIESYSKKTGNKNPRILVAVRQYWPLPYYQHLAGYTGLSYLPNKAFEKNDANRYDILMYPSSINEQVPHANRKYYRLSDVQETHTYYIYPGNSDKG